MIEERFQPHEREAAEAFLDQVAARAKLSNLRKPDEWLRLWQITVEDVRDGYQFSKWDYENDLDGRDIIDGVAALLGPESRALFEEAMRPWDEEFRRLTVESTDWLNGCLVWWPLRHGIGGGPVSQEIGQGVNPESCERITPRRGVARSND